jgi:hypothetical protein
MGASDYPVAVKTIETIRLANYKRLIAELQGEDGPPPADAEIGRALGISKVYAWQLNKGERTAIDSKGARKMERAAGKPEGWMDTDFELWPFDAELLVSIEGLKRDQRLEIQGVLKYEIERLQQGKRSGKFTTSQRGASK